MVGTPTAFGIDFGTTNTRVAYFDGKKLRVIRFVAEADAAREYQVPTLVAYAAGEPVAFGHDAARQPGGALPPRSIKWLLAEDGPIEVDGRAMDPVEIATDFFNYLRQAVGVVVRGEPLRSAAMTIPVDYPPRARTRLQEACQRAGIEITHFFFEPVAALYCNLISRPTSGVAAVFDWGGGSLDIATVQIQDGIAMTRNVQGWRRGGEDFDRRICLQALGAFLREHPEFRLTAEELLTLSERSRLLQRQAEQIKVNKLSRGLPDRLIRNPLYGNASLDFPIRSHDFEQWIAEDVTNAIRRLEQALNATGISPALLERLFLSGGTCNLPFIQHRLAREIAGGRIECTIHLPSEMLLSTSGAGDIGNATAMGAALLAAHGTYPVFASEIGVRLANAWSAEEAFYPVFRAGEAVPFDPHRESFFVTDSSRGVARLLVCDRIDPVRQPQGRLLRVLTVPIHRTENWIDVTFRVDRHLTLHVSATGWIARTQCEDYVHQLNFGFKMPVLDAAPEEVA